MKCPKCDYLGFETGDRCKNCGYDFSLLASPPAEPENLSLKPPAHDDAAVGDLWLDPSDPSTALSTTPEVSARVGSFPLFSTTGDDEPLIKTPSEPRAPLSVRRDPELARSRPASRNLRAMHSGLTLEFAEESPADARPAVEVTPPVRLQAVDRKPPRTPEPLACEPTVASLGSRTLAAFIDHVILLGIDIIVFYSTLRMTALTTDEWRALPLLPFLAFLLLLKLAYFSAFTAIGGQTIGKMAAGIRVVADDHLLMDPSRAITRTLTAVVSLGSLGLGLIPALIGPDRRALHDRVAHTHVVELPSA
jgi:uncharacterized RDD family membrane protein YckC